MGLEKKYEYSSYVGFECDGTEIGLIPKLEKGQKVGPATLSAEFLVDNVKETYEMLKRKELNSLRICMMNLGVEGKQVLQTLTATS